MNESTPFIFRGEVARESEIIKHLRCVNAYLNAAISGLMQAADAALDVDEEDVAAALLVFQRALQRNAAIIEKELHKRDYCTDDTVALLYAMPPVPEGASEEEQASLSLRVAISFSNVTGVMDEGGLSLIGIASPDIRR